MSTFQLLATTIQEIMGYGRLLVRMGRAEMGEELSKAIKGLVLGATAAVVAVLACPFLLMALVEVLIAFGVKPALAFVSVAIALLVFALMFGLVARSQLNPLNCVRNGRSEKRVV